MVSVVIPTHNRAGLVLNAVQSALCQRLPPVEVVVVDDGSSDGTGSVVRHVAGLTYVHQDNRGPSAARNRGFSHARGEFVAFLDSDDTWDTEFLATLVGFLNDNPSLAFAFANWRGVDASGVARYSDYMGSMGYYRGLGSACGAGWQTLDHMQARALFLDHSAAPSSAVVVRRRCVVSWDEAVRIGEDNLFLLEILLRHSCGCAFTTNPLWSKSGSVLNLFDGNANTGELARQHLVMLNVLLGRLRSRLDRGEYRRVRKSMAQDLRDWAYWEACQGRPRRALRLYGESFVTMPSWRCAKGVVALLRAKRVVE